ncbi:MAG: hypothetical protein K1X67_17205 [Fimbriimonadaceae bacterium]|nr:hypothetical protein [Fimbriimonadaceae bacterium]
MSLVSLEEHNPGIFDRFMVFKGEKLTYDMRRLLVRYDIAFLDADALPKGGVAISLPPMQQKQWPADVFLNWVLPEYLERLGYRYSLKLDYDTLSVAAFPTEMFEKDAFSVAILGTEGDTQLPDSVVARARREMGLNVVHERAMQVGIVVLDNEYVSEFELFDRFAGLYSILAEEVPDHPEPLEQVCFAALAANMERTRALAARLHTRSKTTRNIPPGFESSTVLLHFITEFKPWKPLSPRQVVHLTGQKRWPMLPFYRMVWLDYASRVDGFTEYCDQRPYSILEILNMANTILQTEKVKISNAEASSSS